MAPVSVRGSLIMLIVRPLPFRGIAATFSIGTTLLACPLARLLLVACGGGLASRHWPCDDGHLGREIV